MVEVMFQGRNLNYYKCLCDFESESGKIFNNPCREINNNVEYVGFLMVYSNSLRKMLKWMARNGNAAPTDFVLQNYRNMLQHSVCLTCTSSLISVYQRGLPVKKESLRTRTIMLWNEWCLPLQDGAVSENLAATEMKAGCLKMRKDVWTHFLFSVSQWGVYIRRQVMYYLESDLPLCLITAWLREDVPGFFFSPRVRIWMSAQEWRWTCDLRTELSQYLHTPNAECRKLHYTPLLSCT